MDWQAQLQPRWQVMERDHGYEDVAEDEPMELVVYDTWKVNKNSGPRNTRFLGYAGSLDVRYKTMEFLTGTAHSVVLLCSHADPRLADPSCWNPDHEFPKPINNWLSLPVVDGIVGWGSDKEFPVHPAEMSLIYQLMEKHNV